MAAERTKILVVDDEETVQLLFQRVLRAVGYDVSTASNGKDALSIIAAGGIDVVLLDINMPGMSGIEVLSRVSTDWPDLCVIMITAISDVQTAVKAMQLGAYDYITKPFEQEKLLGKIKMAIERWRQQLKDKKQLHQLEQNITEQTKKMQAQFAELVNSLAREHKLLEQLAAEREASGKPPLTGLPPELQKPISTVQEFRDALLRILQRS